MQFTFGIITAGDQRERIHRIIDSIERERIPEYEIIVVGGDRQIERRATHHIAFDEARRAAWITRKKNIVTEAARYDNLVFLHDYVALDNGWYRGFLEHGDEFRAVMTKIFDADGVRYTDWVLSPQSCDGIRTFVVHESLATVRTGTRLKPCGRQPRECLVPYDVESEYLNQFMYFSGAYWVAKKSLMQEIPLDENLSWGQGEDVLWSQWVREKYRFSVNSRSSVRFLKHKGCIYSPLRDDTLENLGEKIAEPLDPRITADLIKQHIAMASTCAKEGDLRALLLHLERAEDLGMDRRHRLSTERLLRERYAKSGNRRDDAAREP